MQRAAPKAGARARLPCLLGGKQQLDASGNHGPRLGGGIAGAGSWLGRRSPADRKGGGVRVHARELLCSLPNRSTAHCARVLELRAEAAAGPGKRVRESACVRGGV